MSNQAAVKSLYRRCLKLSLDWALYRNLWRGQALYIRSLFEANRHVTEPRQQRELLQETEALLERWKHPDPYKAPTAPGGLNPEDSLHLAERYAKNHATGSKYERNLPCPILDPPPPMIL